MSARCCSGSYPPRGTSSNRPWPEMVSGASKRAPAFEMSPMPDRTWSASITIWSAPSIRWIRGARARKAVSMRVDQRSGGSKTWESDERITAGTIGLPSWTPRCSRIRPMSTPYPRDLVGYAGNPPHPHWPGEARIAVNFVINYEEGSEYNVHDDGFSEATLTEAGGADSGVQGRDLAAEGLFEYGSRVGFWRVLRLFKERGLPLTVFGCALALERNPAVAAAIRESGFDVCSHEGRTQPKMMSLGLHLRLIGHPSRAAGLERALDYMQQHKGVWFTRRLDIARHWVATHPAPAR